MCSYAVNVGKEVIEWKFSNIPDDLMDGRMGSLLINYYGKLHCTVVAKFLFSCREVIFTQSVQFHEFALPSVLWPALSNERGD